MSGILELNWHDDGHRINVTLDKQEFVVSSGICPHGATSTAPCFHQGINGCVVNYHINMYGLETNTGTVPASSSIEIAWASSGSEWDVDLVNFTMIPLEDPTFSDWRTYLKGN